MRPLWGTIQTYLFDSMICSLPPYALEIPMESKAYKPKLTTGNPRSRSPASAMGPLNVILRASSHSPASSYVVLQDRRQAHVWDGDYAFK